MAKKIDKTTIGGRIKAARKALGMTQEDLAELMCSTGALICCYEKDKVDLSLSVIRLLAKNLGVSAAYLCLWGGECFGESRKRASFHLWKYK